MKKIVKISFNNLKWRLFIAIIAHISTCFAHQPKVTVIMVTDQFAYHYIPKLKKHFKYGYKFLLEKGINYQEAHHPHGVPETSPGHNSLSTATVPKDHGVIANSWYDHQGHEVKYSESPQPKNPSPELTMVDGLSDSFVLASTDSQKNKVYSISIKDRAAVATANRMGKALWLDHKGCFTSSKTYFKELPAWLQNFNKKADLASKKSISWLPLYDEKSDAYAFPFTKNYDYAVFDFKLCPNKAIPIDQTQKDPYELFNKTPEADKLLFSLARNILENECSPKGNDRMILWVCLSSLDLLAHYYGPDSFEVIDFIYQQDKNLGQFMHDVSKQYGSKNVLFAFTADHGIQPIQELSYKKGITSARRILAQPLIQKMNALVQEKYGVSGVVQNFESSHFYFNHAQLESLDYETKNQISHDLVNYLKSIDGVKNAWTQDELARSEFKAHELEQFYKNQLYRNRSGDIIVMPQPYCLVTKYPKGCTHNTPYDYDTHVPLILYQSGSLEHKTITRKVWIPQLAVTLAKLLGVQHPAASTFDLLPGIFTQDGAHE